MKKEILVDNLADSTPELIEFKMKISQMHDDDLVLIGYAPTLSEDADTFLFFENEDAAKEASELIEKLEAHERQRAKKAIIKQPRQWKSMGSEKEVELTAFRPKTQVLDVEVQSVYPINHPHEPFQFRFVNDVRDGYVELVPRKTISFTNLNRKRVDMFVQSALPRIDLDQQTDPTFPANAWSQYLYEIGQKSLIHEF